MLIAEGVETISGTPCLSVQGATTRLRVETVRDVDAFLRSLSRWRHEEALYRPVVDRLLDARLYLAARDAIHDLYDVPRGHHGA